MGVRGFLTSLRLPGLWLLNGPFVIERGLIPSRPGPEERVRITLVNFTAFAEALGGESQNHVAQRVGSAEIPTIPGSSTKGAVGEEGAALAPSPTGTIGHCP